MLFYKSGEQTMWFYEAVEIKLERFEGHKFDSFMPVTVKTFAEATDLLYKWSHTAPEEGHGYDKCGITIKFNDGAIYETRYDLTRKVVPLDDHCCNGLSYTSGRCRPARATKQQWDAVLNRNPEHTKKCKDFLYNYHFRDEHKYKIDLYENPAIAAPVAFVAFIAGQGWFASELKKDSRIQENVALFSDPALANKVAMAIPGKYCYEIVPAN
jgi:hypothetical protein